MELLKMEEPANGVHLHIQMPRKNHRYPNCRQWTEQIHDYHIQKIKHLKWFERPA